MISLPMVSHDIARHVCDVAYGSALFLIKFGLTQKRIGKFMKNLTQGPFIVQLARCPRADPDEDQIHVPGVGGERANQTAA